MARDIFVEVEVDGEERTYQVFFEPSEVDETVGIMSLGADIVRVRNIVDAEDGQPSDPEVEPGELPEWIYEELEQACVTHLREEANNPEDW